MAAYAALTSLMHTIDHIQNHHSPPISMDKHQVDSLTQIVTFLQEFLHDYSSPVTEEDEADPLEMRIIEAAYAAEDVIETNIVDVIKLSRSATIHGEESRSDSGEEVHYGEEVSCINLYEDLHQVIEEMNLIKKVAMKIDGEKVVSASSAGFLRSSSPSTRQNKNNSMMVCSEDVLNGIMEKLVYGQLNLHVIPIVGMGGIGKTTLARTVYSKPLIKEHFDICVWATVSQQYNIREMLCQLLSRKGELSEKSEDELGLELHKYLFGRRFLIVMDDIWDIDAWDKIRRFFPNNGNGSRILVTTRLSQLSSQLNNNYSLQMEFLDESSSWNLFTKTVFGEEICPVELVKIGKEIVENCRGLPLSIVVVGGLLIKMEHTQVSWESIRHNLTSVVNLENDKHCLRLLKLSYNHLPVYLKPCFLYMGMFEEDKQICVSRLIRLWVSEGFIQPMNGKSLESIAKGFLKDLVDRNLILSHKLGSTGNIKYCKIHDLLRDLCLRESGKYGFYHVIGQGSSQGINSQHRVIILRRTSEQKVVDALQSVSHNTRSFICEKDDASWCQNFGLLRILEKKNNYPSSQSCMGAGVFQCVNLRHIDFALHGNLSSLNLLWNLHTLIVDSWTSGWYAPVGIWKMPQFRHIEFIGRSLCLPDPPIDEGEGIVVMENLQTLRGVKNFKCSEEVVKRIPNVKILKIAYDYSNEEIYCLSNMKSLCKLQSLSISCCTDLRGPASLHKLTFPQSLKTLSFHTINSLFEWEELLGKIGWLPLLEKLKLVGGCFGQGKWETVEGQFPCLKYLELSQCGGLKQWTAAQESSIFPRLEQLLLFQLHELEEIPSEIGDIPTLRSIGLTYCSESAVMSAKRIVDEQVESQGEQLPFHVEVWSKNKAPWSLAGPNFKVQ